MRLLKSHKIVGSRKPGKYDNVMPQTNQVILTNNCFFVKYKKYSDGISKTLSDKMQLLTRQLETYKNPDFKFYFNEKIK